MALQRELVSDGLLEELERFEQLLRGLTPEEWATPSRCEGWTVADVAAHTVGSMADVAAGRLEGLGTPEVTAREVAERRGKSPVELADECGAARKVAADILAGFDDEAWNGQAPGGFDFSLGDGVEGLWYDTFLHADDIRAAIGRPSELGPGLSGAVSHVQYLLADKGWTGSAPRDDDSAMNFVLVATGRHPADSPDSPPNVYA